jgi:3-hydroxyacyl-CoA dehydrogenase
MRFAAMLVVLVIALLIYKFYFTSGQQAMGPAGPMQTIDVIGVKNDLVSMGQAERVYQAEHNAYGTIDDMVSSGAMAYKKTGRQGYTYDSEAASDSFRITARCTAPAPAGCTNFAIDQTMEISSVN